MNFPGYFKEHILPDKVHMINVSFLVDRLQRQRGGTAGNIAYNLALLGVRSQIVASAGSDVTEYLATLTKLGVDVTGVLVASDDYSASAFITTDRADNQITGFYPGAMTRNGARSLHDLDVSSVQWGIIAPDDPVAMVRFPRECRELGIPYIFDPGQGLPVLSGDDLLNSLTGAAVLIANDYELALIQEKTGLSRQQLGQRVKVLVVTLGDRGSEFDSAGKTDYVPVARPNQVLDPTGAGDAFRAGLLVGLTRGFSLAETGRLAALAATYAIEHVGTQAHHYTVTEFAARYRASFLDVPPIGDDLWPNDASELPEANRRDVSARS